MKKSICRHFEMATEKGVFESFLHVWLSFDGSLPAALPDSLQEVSETGIGTENLSLGFNTS